MIRKAAFSLLVSLVLGASVLRGLSTPAPHGAGGAVSSDDLPATRAGLAILAAGGNAVDAAVATALALAVTFPEAGNLGGGGFAVVRMGEDVVTLDFREVAPGAATRDMYLGPDGEPVADKSLVGGLAVGVPGSPTGLYELHKRFGRLSFRQVVAPAVALARGGFVVDENLAAQVTAERELLARFPEAAAVWLPDGKPVTAGTSLAFPDLAATLEAYGERGPTAITSGPVAERVVAVARRHGGILTTGDLAAYRPEWREPIRFSAFGWSWASMDLPSSGGVILGQVSQVLEKLGWAGEPRFGARRVHLMVEALRGAFADRFRLGDPAVAEAATADLLAPDWITTRVGRIDRGRARDSREVDAIPPRPGRESTETTHLSVIDRDGNAVALTTTLNDIFGSRVWVPGFGFLNDEMDDFAARPGRPNDFGLVQGEANAVRPGRRMLSSMSPTLLWREDGELIAAGGRGGSRIPTHTLNVLLNLIVDGDPLQAALDRPRVHHQWLPDEIQVEADAFAPETREALEKLGHRVAIKGRQARVNVVRRLADGTFEAGADPKSPGGGGIVAPRR
jgi:gamma-glutamyltranspeptidase / glutathione hydrolase